MNAGSVVLSSFITPFNKDRELAKKIIGEKNYIEVFVNTSLETCIDRDPKGLYAKSKSGIIKNMTGIDSDYELHRYNLLDKNVFEGTISGIAEHGMYVRMKENHCEGMVQMNQIPGDRFYFDQERFCIRGSKTKKEFNFGDTVKVRVYEVSPRKRQVDLEFVSEE